MSNFSRCCAGDFHSISPPPLPFFCMPILCVVFLYFIMHTCRVRWITILLFAVVEVIVNFKSKAGSESHPWNISHPNWWFGRRGNESAGLAPLILYLMVRVFSWSFKCSANNFMWHNSLFDAAPWTARPDTRDKWKTYRRTFVHPLRLQRTPII